MEKPTSTEKITPASPATKKTYHPPEFSVYGEIREITKNIVSGMGNNDNAHGPEKTGL